MYQPIRDQFFEFVTALINMITATPGLWGIAGPFIIMGVILWVFRWAWSGSRGRTLESMRGELDDLRVTEDDIRLRTGAMSSPGYRQLRQQGFTAREIGMLRQQQPGQPVMSRSALRQAGSRRARIK